MLNIEEITYIREIMQMLKTRYLGFYRTDWDYKQGILLGQFELEEEVLPFLIQVEGFFDEKLEEMPKMVKNFFESKGKSESMNLEYQNLPILRLLEATYVVLLANTDGSKD